MVEKEKIVTKRILTPEAKVWLEREITEDEILDALRSCDNNKAPGPHGFSFAFYLDNGSMVGKDIMRAIKTFFFPS